MNHWLTIFIFILSLPASAQENGAGCQGLSSTEGQLESNIGKRAKTQEDFCDGNRLKAPVEQLGKKLEACKDLGRDLNGNANSIRVDQVFPDIGKRLERACQVHKRYQDVSLSLCRQYGTAAGKTSDTYATEKSAGMYSGQKSDFDSLAKLHGEHASQYKLFSASARDMNRLVSNNMSEIQNGQDSQMAQTLKLLKYQIQTNAQQMEAMAKQKLAQRRQTAASQGQETTMRFKTQADVNRFYSNLSKCKALAADGGDIDKIGKLYQENLPKNLESMKKESADLAERFDKEAGSHASSQQSNEKTATSLGEPEKTGPPSPAKPVISEADHKQLEAQKAAAAADPKSTINYSSPAITPSPEASAPTAAQQAELVAKGRKFDYQGHLLTLTPLRFMQLSSGANADFVPDASTKGFEYGGVHYEIFRQASTGRRFAYPSARR